MTIERPILLDLPMPIRTPRLVIVPVHMEHAEKVHEAIEESLDVLKPWMRWADKPMTLDERKELFVRKYTEYLLREDLMLLVFTHEGEFVIATGLHRIDWEIPKAEIGYWCRKSAHKNGYVTEMANALLRYGFDVLKMEKISIDMDSENAASENVARRLNMQKEYEQVFGLKTLHENKRRIRYSYACFSASELPPLEVSWG